MKNVRIKNRQIKLPKKDNSNNLIKTRNEFKKEN